MTPTAIQALIAFAAAAPATDPGEGLWDDGLESAHWAGVMRAKYEAAALIRAALADLGSTVAPAGKPICDECGRFLHDGHADSCSIEDEDA